MPKNVEQIFNVPYIGGNVTTGAELSGCTPSSNPCRKAYVDWFGRPDVGRLSWDLINTLVAVRGAAAVHLKEVNQGYTMTADVWGWENWQQGSSSNSSKLDFVDRNY